VAVPLNRGGGVTEDVKVLIVDDEPRNLDTLEVMLASTGCTLVRAHSADEALLAMLRHEFAAMIFDIRMPRMGGIELANLVKQRRRTQDVPIIFLTAHSLEDEDVLRAYGVGAVDYLSKPINSNILCSKVSVFIDLYQKTRALALVNHELQHEVAARQKVQETLEQVNLELELRVAERTAALTLAHVGVKENEERLRMAMDVAEIAAWEWDVIGGRMTWSTEPEALFGFPPGWFGENRRVLDTVHPDDREHVRQAVEAAMAAGSSYECEYRLIRPDGVVVWITERGRGLHTEQGEINKIVGMSRDISAQRRAEQAREQALVNERRARDEAERQSRIKDEFLATLSHELRTPMNAILGWLSLLTKGDAVRDPEQAMAVIQRNAQVQAKLIEDLLEMNKLTSGTVRLEVAPLDVGTIIGGTLESLQPTADTKGVRLSLTRESAMLRIHADGRRVQQIVWNLLHNAVKFTRAGGQVDVVVTRAEGCVRITVKDTGQGIAPDFMPYVFDRFRQADPSTTRGTWGLGLGLSITKHLVELHGGSIEASSPGLEKGATFVVQLPVRQVEGSDLPSSSGGDEQIGPSLELTEQSRVS
jgi:PAS domain S-box-containing protein